MCLRGVHPRVQARDPLVPGMPNRPLARARFQRGQSLVEFALLVPLMLLLAVAVVDLGRLFTSAIGVESAAREAADYGAMQGKASWAPANYTQDPATYTPFEKDIRTRACTAASTLSDYAGDPPGTADMNCSNPSFTYDIEPGLGTSDCSLRLEFDDPCIVHVTMTYDFHMFLDFLPLPPTLNLVRESRFAISDLGL